MAIRMVVRPVTPAGPKGTAAVLLAVELFVGFSAVAGGVGLVTGVLTPASREDLAGAPFDRYLIPGLVLALVVGGSMLVAAWNVLTGRPPASVLSLAAGCFLLGWFAVQVALFGYLSSMRPAYATHGLLTVGLAWRLRRTATA